MSKLDRSIPPAVRSFGHLEIPKRRVIDLDNGVQVGIVETGNSPANRLSVVWNYGVANGGGSYTPSMVAPMMMQGTANRSAVEIVDKIDFLGAFLSNQTYSAYTRFEALSLNEFTPAVLDVLADILMNPTFPAERLEALQREAVAKFKVNRKHTRFIAQEKLNELLAGKSHPYAKPTTIDTLTNFDVNDIRRAWADGAGHSKMYINIAGRVEDSLIHAIDHFAHTLRHSADSSSDHLVRTQTGDGTSASPIVKFSPEPSGRYDISLQNARQASMAIGTPTIPRTHPDYVPLRIAVTALGGYFGSRLMTNIREEKGLTYGISAALLGSMEGSSINISAETDKDSIDRVLHEIDAEIARLASQPMDDDELNRLKSFYMTTIAGTLESFRSIGDYYENQLIIGSPVDYFDIQQRTLCGITPEIISQMVEKYIVTSDFRTVVVS